MNKSIPFKFHDREAPSNDIIGNQNDWTIVYIDNNEDVLVKITPTGLTYNETYKQCTLIYSTPPTLSQSKGFIHFFLVNLKF